MPVNGKLKGGVFEREIAKKLSLWITGTSETNVLWRTAGSGGRATQSYKTGEKQEAQIGDIGAIHPAGHWFQQHFVVEAKHYKDLDLVPFLFKGKGLLTKFWEKLVSESNIYSRFPLLIGKQNFIPAFVISETDFIGIEPFILTPEVSLYWLDDFLSIDYAVFKENITSQKLTIQKLTANQIK